MNNAQLLRNMQDICAISIRKRTALYLVTTYIATNNCFFLALKTRENTLYGIMSVSSNTMVAISITAFVVAIAWDKFTFNLTANLFKRERMTFWWAIRRISTRLILIMIINNFGPVSIIYLFQ
jgi:hypothetical protein